jgi:wobble nucleotide-excising tRNase
LEKDLLRKVDEEKEKETKEAEEELELKRKDENETDKISEQNEEDIPLSPSTERADLEKLIPFASTMTDAQLRFALHKAKLVFLSFFLSFFLFLSISTPFPSLSFRKVR